MLPRLEYDFNDRLEDSRFYLKPQSRATSTAGSVYNGGGADHYPHRPPPRQPSSPSLNGSYSPTARQGRLPSPSLPPSPTPQQRYQQDPRYYANEPQPRNALHADINHHSRRGKKLPMAQLLAQHRSTAIPQHPNENRQVKGMVEGVKPPIDEEELLRDVIYLLQGIDGKWVRFKAPPEPVRSETDDEDFDSDSERLSEDGRGVNGNHGGRKVEVAGVDEKVEEREGGIWVVEDSIYAIPPTTLDLLHRLGELGFLFRKISQAILTAPRPARRHHQRLLSTHHHHPGGGMVLQSLHHALQKELQEYYRTIAILESRLSLPTNADSLASPSKHSKPSSQANTTSSQQLLQELEDGGLTLKRVCVWTAEVRLRMRTMSVLLEGSKNTHGGSLISLLHSYTSTGDPFLLKFTTSLLSLVSIPFFKTLSLWIYEGELQDPFEEFFVEVNPEMRDGMRRDGWEDEGFSGREREKDTGGGRREWEGKFGFREGMIPSFVERGFAKKIFSTGKSLNFIKYSCGDKDWIVTRNRLLTDASRELKYSDISGLERSIESAYKIASQRLFDVFFDKFSLLNHLRALKNYLLLGRGDFVEILMDQLGPSLSKPANTLYRHNLTATLETAIRGSTAALDDQSILSRLDARMLEFSHGEVGWEVFTLEYKVSRPLDTVLGTWEMEGYERAFQQLWRLKRAEWTLGEGWRRLMEGGRKFLRVRELDKDFHAARIALSEMLHFVRQMMSFCQVEVIECSWNAFEEFARKKEGDLDELVERHKAYLERILQKSLLIVKNKKGESSHDLLTKVREMFAICNKYKDAVDSLCNFAIAEASRRQSERDPRRGVPATYLPPLNPDGLTTIRTQLAENAGAFQERIQSLVQILSSSSVNKDMDLRLLGARLNFGWFYKTGRDRERDKDRAEGTTRSSVGKKK